MRNQLARSKSPYLLQHQSNPVAWQPWGEEAFALARKENRPVFLSIGYSSCHWCHVMEKDSFEKPEVAEILNNHFVAIKVDREEFPAVDAVYMQTVQMLTGHGGWPLSIFLTPDRRPFWGGTFIERQQFMYVLSEIARAWNSEKRSEIVKQGDLLVSELQNMLSQKQSVRGTLDKSQYDLILKKTVEQLRQNFDKENGGFSHAPKFPQASLLLFLLRAHNQNPDLEIFPLVRKTLLSMAAGGIYDHVGGGFHRYATDAKWRVPHFEKMLYDNALLILTYCEAYQIEAHPVYKHVATECAEYLLRDLSGKGFFSAEDADSEQCEGKFYLWQEEELKGLLSAAQMAVLRRYFDIRPNGNFHTPQHARELERQAGFSELENGNILYLHDSGEIHGSAARFDELRSLKDVLLNHRAKRQRPFLDDKVIVAWNGLAVAALSKSGLLFARPDFTAAAKKIGDFLLSELTVEEKLRRYYREGAGEVNAHLDDYAGLIFGLLQLSEVTGEKKYEDEATRLQDLQNELFWDKSAHLFFSEDGSDPNLITRPYDTEDNATPSGNSLALINLLKLGLLKKNTDYTRQAEQLMAAVAGRVQRYPSAYAFLLGGFAFYFGRPKHLTIVGGKTYQKDLATLYQSYLPNFICNHQDGGDATHYVVCENTFCHAPLKDLSRVKELISENQEIS